MEITFFAKGRQPARQFTLAGAFGLSGLPPRPDEQEPKCQPTSK